MVDFQTRVRTMRLADPEDRALLGSNPSAAVGDGDSDRSNWPTAAPVPKCFFLAALVRKAINPSSFVTVQLGPNRLPNPDRSAIWQYLWSLNRLTYYDPILIISARSRRCFCINLR